MLFATAIICRQQWCSSKFRELFLFHCLSNRRIVMPNTKNLFQRRMNSVPTHRDHLRQAKILSTMAVLPLILILGCSKEEMSQALETAKSKTKSITTSAVEAVENNLPESGEITLHIEPNPITISNANIELISIGDGRPNVVQITTYDPDASSRSYPALLLHGISNISTTPSLAGEKVQCDVYYQADQNSPIAIAKPGEAITVEFQQYNPTDNVLTAKLGTISLRGSDDSVIHIDGGDLLAVIREETK
jgi:hypothetical protein